MALTVSFGTTTDPVNCANKTYTEIKSISGNAIDSENMLYPSFLVNYDARMLACNYCKITTVGTVGSATEINKYYFCKVILENGNNMRINCSIDPLTTYWDTIKSQPVTIVRSTSFGKPTYVQDGMLPVDEARTLAPKMIWFDTIHTDGTNHVDCYNILNTL